MCVKRLAYQARLTQYVGLLCSGPGRRSRTMTDAKRVCLCGQRGKELLGTRRPPALLAAARIHSERCNLFLSDEKGKEEYFKSGTFVKWEED